MSPQPIEVMCGHDDLCIPLAGVPFPRPKCSAGGRRRLRRWRLFSRRAKAGLLPSVLRSNHGCFMRNRDLVSDSFLTLTAVGLVVLCSSLLALAFT